MDIMSNFSERLNELLFDNGLSPEQFACEIGVSRATVYRWKIQPFRIFLSNLIAIADYFQCSIEFIIGRTEDNHRVTPKDYPKFSHRLRQVMKERGFSTYSLRKISRFDGKYFYKWDRGTDPVLPTLIELASIFGCSIDYLVGRDI